MYICGCDCSAGVRDLFLSAVFVLISEVIHVNLYFNDPYRLIQDAIPVQAADPKWNYKLVHVVGRLTVLENETTLQGYMDGYAEDYKKYGDTLNSEPCGITVPQDAIALVRTFYSHRYHESYCPDDLAGCWRGDSCESTQHYGAFTARLFSPLLMIEGTGFQVDLPGKLHHEFQPYLEPLVVTNGTGCEGTTLDNFEIDKFNCSTQETEPFRVSGILTTPKNIRGYQILKPIEVTIIGIPDPESGFDGDDTPVLSRGYRSPTGLGIFLIRPGVHSPIDMASEFRTMYEGSKDYGDQSKQYLYETLAWGIRLGCVWLAFVANKTLALKCTCCKGGFANDTYTSTAFMLGWGIFYLCLLCGAFRMIYVPLWRNFFLWMSGAIGICLLLVALLHRPCCGASAGATTPTEHDAVELADVTGTGQQQQDTFTDEPEFTDEPPNVVS